MCVCVCVCVYIYICARGWAISPFLFLCASGTDALMFVSFKKRLVDCLLSLLLRGCVPPVMLALFEYSVHGADLSIVRHLALRLLSIVNIYI